jgi:hypothetical protein
MAKRVKRRVVLGEGYLKSCREVDKSEHEVTFTTHDDTWKNAILQGLTHRAKLRVVAEVLDD